MARCSWMPPGPYGATVVSVYSPRVQPGTTVSCPVAWDDLDRVTPAEMPAPRARSSMEMSANARSSSNRSAVLRIACSRSSPDGRDPRLPRGALSPVRGGFMEWMIPGVEIVDRALTISTYRW